MVAVEVFRAARMLQRRGHVTCGTAKYVCPGGNDYSLFASKFAPGADESKFPYGPQNDSYSYRNGAKGSSIQMFSPEQLPVKTALVKNFGVFNKLYSSVPAASTPNHLCMFLFENSAPCCAAPP